MNSFNPHWFDQGGKRMFNRSGGASLTRSYRRKSTSAFFSLILVLLFGAVICQPAFAQERTISGRVIDAEDNSGLPGVNVTVKGTTSGTVTSTDGSYSLSVPANATLVYSFIGYQTQEIPVGNQSTINVSLATDVQTLSEVVVIGYGTQEKKDVTGSISQVSSKEFNPGINPNPLQAIQGKVAGLVITQPSGDPNASPNVRLRGYTSLAGGSDPLYVVDGVIGVPINSVAPEDIQSIDVLKDASAAAIYGSRAANGVIIVTTRRGQAGRTTVGFNNYIGVETIARRLDMLNADEYREQVARIKGEASFADRQRFPVDANGQGYSTDWMDETTRTALTNNHDLSIMGGSENFSYRGSLNYINRDGIIKNTGFERVTGRINLDQRAINNKLHIQYNLSLTNQNSQRTNGGVIERAITFLPTLPVRDPSGANNIGGYYEVGGSFDLFNPVAMMENFQNDQTRRVLIGGVNMTYEIFQGFNVGVNGAYRNENEVNSEAYNQVIKAYQGNQGLAYRELRQVNNRLLEVTSSYTRAFGANSNFNVLGGYSYQDNVDDGFRAENRNFIEGLYDIFGYNNLGFGRASLTEGRDSYATSYANRTTLISFFGRATVNLLDRYNLTATVRQDGSSKFGADNKWAVFPSFAGGWILSNEGFLQGSNAISFLKLRAGWGLTGNSEGIRPYQSLLLYGRRGSFFDGSIGDFVPGIDVVQNTNPTLRWERLGQTNIGLDFGLFNRIDGTIEVYEKNTRDMLYNYNVSADGVRYFTNTITANVGRMRNRGIELSLGANVIETNDFTWNARIVGAAFRNTIVSLRNDEFDVGVILYNPFGGRGLSNVWASRLEEGRPLGEFLIPRFAGFAENGAVLLETDEPGVTTTSYSDARLDYAGIAQPIVTGSFINTVRYRNFDLNFQLRGVFGNQIMNNLRSNLAIPGSILETNMLREVANYPINYSINQLSDLWMESGSFVRLDNWQLGYNVPAFGVFQNARIYVGGNNLFVISGYKGIDPELQNRGELQDGGLSQQPNDMGMDRGNIYPRTRSFMAGINMTF